MGVLSVRFLHFAARAVVIGLGAAWLVASAAHGGLCSAMTEAWKGIAADDRHRARARDARRPRRGPYFQVLERLEEELDGREATVAVVLSGRDRPLYRRFSPKRTYEAIYRLYPAKVDLYLPVSESGHELFWFDCPAEDVPRVPDLWRHDYVLWVVRGPADPPATYRLICQNEAVRLYRRLEE